jgi:hypothetical protein
MSRVRSPYSAPSFIPSLAFPVVRGRATACLTSDRERVCLPRHGPDASDRSPSGRHRAFATAGSGTEDHRGHDHPVLPRASRRGAAGAGDRGGPCPVCGLRRAPCVRTPPARPLQVRSREAHVRAVHRTLLSPRDAGEHTPCHALLRAPNDDPPPSAGSRASARSPTRPSHRLRASLLALPFLDRHYGWHYAMNHR